MRVLFGIVLTVGLLLSSIAGVSAQESSADVLNQPVAYADEDGVTATLSVNAIHDYFADYSPDRAPDYRYRYVLVEFTIQNEGEQSTVVGVSGFSLLSDYGQFYSPRYAGLESDDFTIFQDDLPLASGESATVAQFYQIPVHTQPAFFVWSWSTDYRVMVDLGAEPHPNSAFAYGPESVALFTDEFGNPVASMQATDINMEVEGYSSSSLEAGDQFALAHISITNLTDRDVDISNYDFSLQDSTGTYWDTSYLRPDKGVEPEPFRGEIYLAPGESVEIVVAFNITGASDIVGMRWMPTWSDTVIHYLAEPGSELPATPQATPDGD